jgi:hypothetical protein
VFQLNRRTLFKLGAGLTAALTSAGAAAQQRPSRTMNLGAYGESGRADELARRHHPILFWNDVSLQLVALDHSIDAADARAPGPCASARALGLAHIVMADAVAAAYPVDFEGLYVRDRAPIEDYPEVFVGGAAAWILEYIFSTPAHSQLIGAQRLRFLDSYEPAALRSWEAGLSFARNEAFTAHWRWEDIRKAVISTPTTYVPAPRGHTVDPFNADQGFYGVDWGRFPTLDTRLGEVASYAPPEPPRERDPEYRHDFEEVLRLGAYAQEGSAPEQVQIGLFWAYDGARLIGTPPRLYNQIVRQIAEDDGMSVPEMARLLALCNLAMADAGNVAWEAKYRYGVWRPVVAIRHGLEQPRPGWRPFGSPRTNPAQFALGKDTQFRATAQSFLGAAEQVLPEPADRTLPYKLAAFTPNFPAYPSGHATFGAACFNILRKVRAERAATRSDPDRLRPAIEFVSDELNGVSIDNFANRPRPYLPRTYSSVQRLIEENNRSRVHLGVHWNFDCDRGEVSGALVADGVYGHAYRRGPARLPTIGARQRRYESGRL